MASWAHRLFQQHHIDPEEFFLMKYEKKLFLIASCLIQDERDKEAQDNAAAEAQE
ncbi:hypothetical protein OCD90_26015 [Bacillus pacificus]|uniref:hypothetical protein n=1 Tax=Bacillus TaxID=1386 RepID=UPI001297EFCB|nr:hypothetical protein [Bacillus pacificus]MCC2419295.1 hypothetical protein [Bacillus pacificus]MCU5005768.1 hypothetical protein [Bacillus pacificus]MCU5259200.1 hypothetical protein [Bacillus pacificus]MCU5561974.1 hypothetical protein [Bacillus pacificus]HDR3524194.1 hypothetical protein [Bacillus pacificus]